MPAWKRRAGPYYSWTARSPTALTHGLVLVTRNVRDFMPFDGLVVEGWFEG